MKAVKTVSTIAAGTAGVAWPVRLVGMGRAARIYVDATKTKLGSSSV
jgi:hypothetical protein